MDQVSITRHGDDQRGEYHAHVAGAKAIGRLTWQAKGNRRVADHTLVPGEIGGRGVAARLVEALVDDAREHGFLIEPACSYVAAWFERHPEAAGLLAGKQG
jgi:uncharacterized protein